MRSRLEIPEEARASLVEHMHGRFVQLRLPAKAPVRKTIEAVARKRRACP